MSAWIYTNRGTKRRKRGRKAEQPMSGLPDIGKKLGEPRRMGAQVSDKVLGD
jgi:hypothetical protein